MKSMELKIVLKDPKVTMDEIIDALQYIAPVELYWIRKEQASPIPINSPRLEKRVKAKP